MFATPAGWSERSAAPASFSMRGDYAFAAADCKSDSFHMSAWVRSSRGQLAYGGRITRGPFAAWTKSDQGQAAVAAVATNIRFSLFGKRRAAAGRLWRALVNMAGDAGIAATIELEVQAYLPRLGELAFADGLPRGGVDLRRLVVIPNVLLNGAAYNGIVNGLGRQPAFASLEGGDTLREFFITTLVGEMEAAVTRARPSVGSPVAATADWVSVGVNTSFAWGVPIFNEPAWNGHHYVLEVTREPVTRAVRKAVNERIDRFEASLQTLSRAERNDILRRARQAA